MDSDPDAWPFQVLDLDKVRQLPPPDLYRLEGMLMALARDCGLDVANAKAA